MASFENVETEATMIPGFFFGLRALVIWDTTKQVCETKNDGLSLMEL
jgi:hypothetical protein